MGEAVSEPIVPPVERYFQSFYLLEKLLAVNLVDVFRIALFGVKHLVSKDCEHEIFLFRVASNGKSAVDVGLIGEWIEIYICHRERCDRNWRPHNRCLTIC